MAKRSRRYKGTSTVLNHDYLPTKEEVRVYDRYKATMEEHGFKVRPLEQWIWTYRQKKLQELNKKQVQAEGVPERKAIVRQVIKNKLDKTRFPPFGQTRCRHCQLEQIDKGKGQTCERCGASPLPSRRYRRTSVFHTESR